MAHTYQSFIKTLGFKFQRQCYCAIKSTQTRNKQNFIKIYKGSRDCNKK